MLERRRLKVMLITVVCLEFLMTAAVERRISLMQENEGKRWAICIGINDYEKPGILDLKKARNDATGLAKILKENGQFDEVFVFTDEIADKDGKRNDFYATRSNILGYLDFLADFIKPQDLVVFHFSGHGIMDGKGNGYLIPVDGSPADFFGSSIPVKKITAWLQKTGVRKSLLMIDACRESLEVNKGVSQNGLRAEQFNRAEVTAVFYATKAGKYSYEDDDSDYGVFTKFLVNGLTGSADTEYDGNKDGIVTFKELQGYVEEGVSAWALKERKSQIPYTQLLGEQTGNLALSISSGMVPALQTDTTAYETTLPPSASDVDLSKLKAEAERIRKENEKAAWKSWQRQFDAAVEEAKKLDGDKNLSTKSKKSAWEKVLSGFTTDNPYSSEDENLRKYVRDRINYWTKEASKPTATVTASSGSYYGSGDSSDPEYYNMAQIPAGSFEMGSNASKSNKKSMYYVEHGGNNLLKLLANGKWDEWPLHTVNISEFWMDKYEVTNGEYKKCVDAGSCRAPYESKSDTRSNYYGDSRYDNYPVINVSWDDARKYCSWKGKRLPTEAEWEYTARGGLEGARYPWGDAIKGSDANYYDSGDSEDNDTTAVGSYAANGYGLYDMAGNVFEWVTDWYEDNYYKSSPPRDPQGPTSGTYRVIRGGSWVHESSGVRVSNRNKLSSTLRVFIIGFRCAR